MNNEHTNSTTSTGESYIEIPLRSAGSPIKLDALLKKRMRLFMKLKFSNVQAPGESR